MATIKVKVDGQWTHINMPYAEDASETVKGIAELATQDEVDTGTDAVRIVTPATLQGKIDDLAETSHPTGDGNLNVPATGTTSDGKVLTAGPTAGALSWITPSGSNVDASELAKGIAELATQAEVIAGTDASRIVTPATLQAALKKTFTQTIASDTWVVPHDMNRYPAVSIIDSGGSLVGGDVLYTDVNNLQITFAYAFAGTAYLS